MLIFINRDIAVNGDSCSEKKKIYHLHRLQKIILTWVLNIHIILLLESLNNTELIVIQLGVTKKSTIACEKGQPRTAVHSYPLLPGQA